MIHPEEERIQEEVAKTYGSKIKRAFDPSIIVPEDDLKNLPEAQEYEKEFEEKTPKMKAAFEEKVSLPLDDSFLNPDAKAFTPVKKGGSDDDELGGCLGCQTGTGNPDAHDKDCPVICDTQHVPGRDYSPAIKKSGGAKKNKKHTAKKHTAKKSGGAKKNKKHTAKKSGGAKKNKKHTAKKSGGAKNKKHTAKKHRK